jgi:hypothetical protein
MTTTLNVPGGERILPYAGMVQKLMEETSPGSAPSLEVIRDVLLAAVTLATGPRYVAEHDGTHDSLGSPGYIVRDRQTGHVEQVYEGYFAGQDARSYARLLNGEED